MVLHVSAKDSETPAEKPSASIQTEMVVVSDREFVTATEEEIVSV